MATIAIMNKRLPVGELLIVGAACIWGVAFYYQKIAMNVMGPILFIGLRGLIASITLLPFVWAEQRTHDRPVRKIWPIACLGGVVFFIAGVLQQWGLVTATVTNTGFLTALYVVVTPFLYWLIKRRSLTLQTWVSAFMAFLGVWALGGGTVDALSAGDLLVAFSSLFWALLIIVSGEAANHATPMSYTCVKFSMVAILGLTLAPWFEPVSLDQIRQAWLPLLYVGVLSSALTFGLMAVALKSVAAPTASILLATETLFAAAAGYWLLGERLSLIGWLGAVLIIASVLSLKLFSAKASG